MIGYIYKYIYIVYECIFHKYTLTHTHTLIHT